MGEGKSELVRLREIRESAEFDLLYLRKYAGESPAIDANLRHKAEDLKKLNEQISLLEAQEAEEAARQGVQERMW